MDKIEWKLTQKAEETKLALENEEEIEDANFGCSDGFWYAITDGGYFVPEKALSDPEQIQKVNDAVVLLEDLERNVYNKLNPEW